ncbi:MAG: excinuclease ABC subunit UvrC [Flavobacteriales bacterium]
MEVSDHIKSIIKALPEKAGVYQFFDENGSILYVGKAKVLKNRVTSYFNKIKHDSIKTKLMVKKIRDIKYSVVETESDALLLEDSLIKKFKPRYNILLKDDKSYASIVIKNEPFPRVLSTRQILDDGSTYFGPYTSGRSLYSILDLIKELYPLRSCTLNLSKANIQAKKFKVCLEYHLGNCLGPCVGKQREEDYQQGIQHIKRIIKGEYLEAVKNLKKDMLQLASEQKFEQAQQLKERIQTLENFQAKSTIVNTDIDNVEVFSIASDAQSTYANYMHILRGSIVHVYTAEVVRQLDETDEEVLAFVVRSFRERMNSKAKTALLPFELNEKIPGLEVTVPQRGDKKKLVDLSLKNANHFLLEARKRAAFLDPERNTQRILETMKKDLHLSELPVHIECFDNSNIQGTNPVSACVVFKNAKPSKSDYRIFNIQSVVGPDDFASMREAIYRRYSRLIREEQPLPQLLIIDGGKGQLSSAMESLDLLGLRGKIAVIGIAKRLEEIFFPGDSIPIYLDKRSESLKIIQHLRNEAHRYGLSKHRQRRSKGAIHSELENIAGVGKKTIEKLLQHFSSVARIKSATQKEIEQVVGEKIAEKIKNYFGKAQ